MLPSEWDNPDEAVIPPEFGAVPGSVCLRPGDPFGASAHGLWVMPWHHSQALPYRTPWNCNRHRTQISLTRLALSPYKGDCSQVYTTIKLIKILQYILVVNEFLLYFQRKHTNWCNLCQNCKSLPESDFVTPTLNQWTFKNNTIQCQSLIYPLIETPLVSLLKAHYFSEGCSQDKQPRVRAVPWNKILRAGSRGFIKEPSIDF